MSATTAAQHTIAELVYVAADDINNVVTYRSRSASKPGQYNTTLLNVLDYSTSCNCAAAQHGRTCWHVEHVATAWVQHPERILASRYNAEQLSNAGRKAHRMVTVYRARCWRTLPADRLALLACRDEYRRRAEAVLLLEAADAA